MPNKYARRNKQIVKDRTKLSIRKVAKKHNLSPTRIVQILEKESLRTRSAVYKSRKGI